jgi:hypothetical protein
MKPDKLDIKIQEAAAQNEPAYTEEAWSAMEKLLDEKMPQKKKDKKKFFWLFLFLFIVAGGASLLLWPGKDNRNEMALQKTNAAKLPTGRKDDTQMTQNDTSTKSISSYFTAPPVKPKSVNKKNQSLQTTINNGSQVMVNNKNIDNNNDEVFPRAEKKTEETKNQFIQKTRLPANKETSQDENEQTAITGSGKDSSIRKGENIFKTKDSLITQENNHDTSLKKTSASKPQKKFANSFAIDFSAGPDVSAIGLENIGKMQVVYGAGVRYSISKKLTVRTGFYVERKIYDAQPSAYNPPSGFWNYYPNLKYIDADCKVYEVPLLVNYNFNQSLHHQWFASAGLSSYFMKNEDYKYFSKNLSGQSWYDTYEVRNKNRHYFSSFRLSAGYEKELGKNISLIAEPYINLPLSGVGYGKVKLNSAGILFSLSVKPFSKK